MRINMVAVAKDTRRKLSRVKRTTEFYEKSMPADCRRITVIPA